MGIGTELKVVKGIAELETILKTGGKLITLVYATWCPFCMRFLPVFRKYANDERFILVEDNNEEIADRYDVDIIPTVLIFENGQVIKRLDGVAGLGLVESEFAEFIKEK